MIRVLILLLVLVMPARAMSEDDYSFLYALGIYLTATGIGPALVIILTIALLIGIIRMFLRIGHRVKHPKEYRKIPEAEKKKAVREACRNEHDCFL